MEEEDRELLEAVYQEDFVALDGAWRIRVELGCVLVLRLGAKYPEEAPEVALELEPWPAHGDALVRRLEDLRPLWAGDCLQWVESVIAECKAARDASECKAATEAEAPEPEASSVPLTASTARAAERSLLEAGFAACGPGLFSASDRGVTVELQEELTVTVDGVDAEDLGDWSAMQLSADAENFGSRLLEWVAAQRSPEPGFLEDAEESSGPDFLPSPEELGVKRDRGLLVYTWGKALRKHAPGDSEHNFNAGILNGRGGGADLKSMNGLWDEVQSNVASCGLFPRWISMVCAKVEHSDLKCISINCTKGRHRSVAAAEILKKTYYPQATVKHLTIY
ncbi:unnamed protein product [Effrenium voratum]|uniref:RWD domain-containing protein n=1 Tax=Effrenium voratum TaxID=2562239 RepID=A0AA36HX36_9DINO|nr:unnamed protein product [Effrenium voratum]CAJ1375768.1 unnamed protein product [Effrenium voratum]